MALTLLCPDDNFGKERFVPSVSPWSTEPFLLCTQYNQKVEVREESNYSWQSDTLMCLSCRTTIDTDLMHYCLIQIYHICHSYFEAGDNIFNAHDSFDEFVIEDFPISTSYVFHLTTTNGSYFMYHIALLNIRNKIQNYQM